MKHTFLAITLLALAPVSAIAGGSLAAENGQAATADKACAFHQEACATVDRRKLSFEW